MSAEIPAGYMQIPRSAWLLIPKNSKVIIKTQNNDYETPIYVLSVQDTTGGLIVVTTRTRSGVRQGKSTNIPGDIIIELWKYISDECQLELMMLLDVNTTQTDTIMQQNDDLAVLKTTIATLSGNLPDTYSRLTMSENNLATARRTISSLSENIVDIRRELAETRRQMESLARLTKSLLSADASSASTAQSTAVGMQTTHRGISTKSDRVQPEVPSREQSSYDQIPQRNISRKHCTMGRASVTDRMFIPDSPM